MLERKKARPCCTVLRSVYKARVPGPLPLWLLYVLVAVLIIHSLLWPLRGATKDAGTATTPSIKMCTVDCGGNGACFDDFCLCDVGWGGLRCDEDRRQSIRSETRKVQTTMDGIYQRNGWNSPFSKSGPGSTMRQTERIRRAIPNLLRMTKSQVLLDGGCGDMHWMRHVELPSGTRYVGCDVAPSQIKGLRRWFGPGKAHDAEAGFMERPDDIEDKGLPTHRPELSFFVCDLGALQLASLKPDIVMLRDVLFHIPPEELRQAINSADKANASYLLTTSFIGGDNKRSVHYPGDFWPINLRAAPYNFPNPDFVVPNSHSDMDSKFMGLWRLEDIKDLPFLKNRQEIWGDYVKP